MNYSQVLEHLKHEVIRFYKEREEPGLTYHNLQHTQEVVAHAVKLLNHYQLNDKESFIVMVAAWYHDIGYFNGGATGHEERGAAMAETFLRENGAEEDVILAVRNCIMATVLPQSPQTLLEKIIADADLYHFGTDDFAERNKLMRKEAEWRTGNKIPKSQWRHKTVQLLQAHHYQTDYAQELLDAKKAFNIEKLKAKDDDELISPKEILKEEKKTPDPEVFSKTTKKDRPNRGIETMFRISSSNHQRLSDMADNKAHIMITTTSIILSVLLSVLLRKLEDNPHLVIPTMIMLTVCVVTMVFSILATRPAIPDGRFTHDDVAQKKVNLLFFGNFYRMSYEEYAEGVNAMMKDREFLYGSLTKDVYSQGLVLGKKYRLLRIGYNVFMFGIIVAVLAFVVSTMIFGH
ncbi:Pycsar system effector family protein [Ferruginibacter sp. HRS2-29]|uniref:Pycsar system effector family protein n=1 Tax=Ferruginibacter sp. HRS2-29 TaxID=2487334 RepID=UPI0020CD0D39|nr:Pycsar system effector family protein [Ferruginibacter sp. HRS2-29]MCP9749796.1 HD domain-containing protein [Ferruginibacter sp. HRS2-29]